MIDNNIFQQIFDELKKYLEDGWDRMVVYLEYGIASYSFEFFVKKEGIYKKCYNLDGVSEYELADSFSAIHAVLSKEREKNTNDNWSNMTVIIENDGNIHVDFDYTDLSSGTYMYKKEWKKKYLV